MNLSKPARTWLTLAVTVVVLVIAFLATRNTDHARNTQAVTTVATATAEATGTATPKPGGRTTTATQSATPSKVPGVPDRAYATLVEIDAGRWPDSAGAPGTHGGDTWNNRERSLPAKDGSGKAISYREWDVNPKKAGQTRDAERIITGSDGSAYYTGDHYKTFTRMR